MRWRVEHVLPHLWIAYQDDGDRAAIFRTWHHAMRHATTGGVA